MEQLHDLSLARLGERLHGGEDGATRLTPGRAFGLRRFAGGEELAHRDREGPSECVDGLEARGLRALLERGEELKRDVGGLREVRLRPPTLLPESRDPSLEVAAGFGRRGDVRTGDVVGAANNNTFAT